MRKLEAWLLLEVKSFLLGAKAIKQLNEVDTKFMIFKKRRIFWRKEAGIKKPVTFKLIENELIYLILRRRQSFLTLLKLFKLTIQSYVKKMKKVNFYKKISLFNFVDSYFGFHYHKLCSYCNSIWELKSDNQRRGRW